jgi:homoserine dehydrogenase
LGKDLKIIQIGFGAVGHSLSMTLAMEGAELRAKHGFGIATVAIADSSSSVVDTHGVKLNSVLRRKARTGRVGETNGPPVVDLIEQVKADVVVELTPASPAKGEPSLSHIRGALGSGKHVVTTNKVPLALHYRALVEQASKSGLLLKYGGCVGGGLPALEFGESCALADHVIKIDGVLNATSNFILSEMSNSRGSFSEALKTAQREGYAEADPSLDVGGFDAACKIVILTNHVLRKGYRLGDADPVQGIDRLTGSALRKAEGRGMTLRMIATSEPHPQVRVVEIPRDDDLAVQGASSAIRFQCEKSGPRTISGPGAGGRSTSTAVLRDLVRVGETMMRSWR